jgi:hypothetical protein
MKIKSNNEKKGENNLILFLFFRPLTHSSTLLLFSSSTLLLALLFSILALLFSKKMNYRFLVFQFSIEEKKIEMKNLIKLKCIFKEKTIAISKASAIKMNTNTETTPSMKTEMSLKCEISRQVRMKDNQTDRADLNEYSLMKTWKKLYDGGFSHDLITEMVWDYINDARLRRQTVWVQTESRLIGQYSQIAPYTNKKGKVSQAHFSTHGTYIGSVAKLGNKPVSYTGYFEVEGKCGYFTVDLKAFERQTAPTKISSLFVPNPFAYRRLDGDAEEKEKKKKPKFIIEDDDEDDDDTPIATLIAKKKAIKKIAK